LLVKISRRPTESASLIDGGFLPRLKPNGRFAGEFLTSVSIVLLDAHYGELKVIVKAGRQYRSRRGERVLVTEIDPTGAWPVHFVVMDGRYQGVGLRDGSRLKINGRATEPVGEAFADHWNDLVAECSVDLAKSKTRNVPHLSNARKREPTRRAG
jgi:hypothetical protein